MDCVCRGLQRTEPKSVFWGSTVYTVTAKMRVRSNGSNTQFCVHSHRNSRNAAATIRKARARLCAGAYRHVFLASLSALHTFAQIRLDVWGMGRQEEVPVPHCTGGTCHQPFQSATTYSLSALRTLQSFEKLPTQVVRHRSSVDSQLIVGAWGLGGDFHRHRIIACGCFVNDTLLMLTSPESAPSPSPNYDCAAAPRFRSPQREAIPDRAQIGLPRSTLLI